MKKLKDWTLSITMPEEAERKLRAKAVALGITPEQLIFYWLEWDVNHPDEFKQAYREYQEDGSPDYGVQAEWTPNYIDDSPA